MKFTKMHGLGNDYVFVDGRAEDVLHPEQLARDVSNRHEGVGSDGLILLRSSQCADLRMVMYNADGSRGEMCGNGLRCVAKYAVERGLVVGPTVQIETDAGVRYAECLSHGGCTDAVRVDMGMPRLAAADVGTTINAERLVDHMLEVAGVPYRITCVSMGNPHCVVYVEDLTAIALDTVGPLFEHAPEFPARMNAHFVRVDGRDRVTIKTWERGSGITQACGSGACAVCVAGVLTGRTDRRIVASLPGGDLEIEWGGDDHVHMTGPAVEVFTGDWG